LELNKNVIPILRPLIQPDMKFYKTAAIFLAVSILNACATFKTQYNNAIKQSAFPDKKIAHSFYFIRNGI